MSLVKASVVAALLAFVFLSPHQVSAADPASAPALTVSLTQITKRDWPETIPASGWLKPWQEAVIASETNGLRVTEILVDVGSAVKKGDVLARLSQETVLADLRKQEAAVEVAKANLTKAITDADRARALGPSGALSKEKVVEYLATEQTSTANLKSEEAGLESAKIKLAQTTVTAVDDGVITSRSIDLGAVVSTGTEFFRLIRQQRIEWQAEVSARYLKRISQGLAVKISEISDEAVDGQVRLVAPSISTDTGRAIVYVSLPAYLKPRVGLYVTGSVELQATPALVVPDTAIVYRDGISYVFSVGKDDRARRTRVDTGRRREGEVEITSPIDQNAQIVSTGGTFLSDNDLVRISGRS